MIDHRQSSQRISQPSSSRIERSKLPFASKAIVFYTLSVWILSITATCWDMNEVPFKYNLLVECTSVINAYYLALTQILVIYVGGYVAYATPIRPAILTVRFSPKRSIAIASIIVHYGIILWFIYLVIDAGLDAYKPLTQKSSILLVIISSLAAISSIALRRFSALHLLGLTTITLMFGYFDTSRTALVPGAILLLYAFTNRRRALSVLGLTLISIGLLLSFGLRADVDQAGKSIELLMSSISSSQINYFRSYVFEFSYLHFLYTMAQSPLMFDAKDLVYSITPLPSAILPPSSDPDTWRLDKYRPYGAMAETLNVGYTFFLLFNFLFGFLATAITFSRSTLLRLGGTALVVFGYMASYQYGLRTIQWFLWISLAISYIPTTRIHNEHPQ